MWIQEEKWVLGPPIYNILMIASLRWKLREARCSSPCALHAALLSGITTPSRAEAGVELAPSRQEPAITQASMGCHQRRIPFDEASYPGNPFLIKQDTWVRRKGHCRPFRVLRERAVGRANRKPRDGPLVATPPLPRGVGQVTSHLELVLLPLRQ